MKCDVCLKEFAHTSVYSSSLGAASFSFCEDCTRLGLEPYCAIVYTMWMLDGKVENSSDPEWLEWMIDKVLGLLNKTWDDLINEAREFGEKLNAAEEKDRHAAQEKIKPEFEDFKFDLF